MLTLLSTRSNTAITFDVYSRSSNQDSRTLTDTAQIELFINNVVWFQHNLNVLKIWLGDGDAHFKYSDSDWYDDTSEEMWEAESQGRKVVLEATKEVIEYITALGSTSATDQPIELRELQVTGWLSSDYTDQEGCYYYWVQYFVK